MSSPELHLWVDVVIKLTDSGEIKWKQLNPTSYSWEQVAPKNARVILQRVERLMPFRTAQGSVAQKKVSYYILQVFETAKQPSPMVTLNGPDDAESNTQLEKLYSIVEKVSERENLDFLNSLLPGGPAPGGSHT
jgi:hypothetical protein